MCWSIICCGGSCGWLGCNISMDEYIKLTTDTQAHTYHISTQIHMYGWKRTDLKQPEAARAPDEERGRLLCLCGGGDGVTYVLCMFDRASRYVSIYVRVRCRSR